MATKRACASPIGGVGDRRDGDPLQIRVQRRRHAHLAEIGFERLVAAGATQSAK
jgi:hypothetical protein